MTAKPSSNATASRLSEVKARMGHVPLIRRNSFVYSFLTLLVLYGAFLLPPSGAPATVGLSMIVLFFLLLIAWAVIIFTDELKPEVLKTVSRFCHPCGCGLALLPIFNRPLGRDDLFVF